MILTEQQDMFRNLASQFATEKLRPNSAQWDRESRFPREAITALAELGFMGINVPEEWDGVGADYVSMALALEEIARGDAATSTIMSGHNSVGCMPIMNFGTNDQKETYLRPMARGEKIGVFCLTEAHGGSDAGALTTKACRNGNGYVISGSKQFITSGREGDVAIVFASTDPEAGSKGISAFIVPTDSLGYVATRVEDKLGQRASDTAQVSFEDMSVTADQVLGEAGQGYRIALSNLEGGRIGIAAQGVGIAQAALDIAMDYAEERKVFGKQIVDHQAVGFRLAAMATRVETARQIVLHTATLKDAGRPCLKEACMAKLVSSEAAEWVCSEAIQILGGYGYLKDYGVEQLYRDARACRIYEGTNDIQNLVILREMRRARGTA